MVTKKEIQEYLKLPWTYTIEQEDGYYIIYVNELPGVCTDAETIDQAVKNIQEAIMGAVELYLEKGETVPIPIKKTDYKGNISYRTSPERHYKIAKLAHKKHESLSKTIDLLVDDYLKQNRQDNFKSMD